jgi:transketolase
MTSCLFKTSRRSPSRSGGFDESLSSTTSLSFTEDVQKRYEAYGWHVHEVMDVVTQLDDLRAAIKNVQDCTDKPSMIAVKTLIGYGSPSKEGLHAAHGAPLGKTDLAGTKEAYDLPSDNMFYVADDVTAVFQEAITKNETKLDAWQAMFDKFQGIG